MLLPCAKEKGPSSRGLFLLSCCCFDALAPCLKAGALRRICGKKDRPQKEGLPSLTGCEFVAGWNLCFTTSVRALHRNASGFPKHLPANWGYGKFASIWIAHSPPLSLLHFRHSICKLSSTVRPPLHHGTIWSPCISSNAYSAIIPCATHIGHLWPRNHKLFYHVAANPDYIIFQQRKELLVRNHVLVADNQELLIVFHQRSDIEANF